MGYIRFAAMIASGTAVMFGLMYLNTYALGHTACDVPPHLLSDIAQTKLFVRFGR